MRLFSSRPDRAADRCANTAAAAAVCRRLRRGSQSQPTPSRVGSRGGPPLFNSSTDRSAVRHPETKSQTCELVSCCRVRTYSSHRLPTSFPFKRTNQLRLKQHTMVPVGSDQAAEAAMDGECSPPAATTTRSGTSRSHSEAERKRRQRINAHLATLRTLLPAASRVRPTSLLFRAHRGMQHARMRRG